MSDLREMGPGTVILLTFLSDERYHVILITPQVQKAVTVPIAAAQLSGKVFAFRQALQNPESDPAPLARELYSILIGPSLARDLEQASARTLMWSLDGVLRYLPVAALHDGRQYLVERFQTTVFTRPAEPDQGSVVAVADGPGCRRVEGAAWLLATSRCRRGVARHHSGSRRRRRKASCVDVCCWTRRSPNPRYGPSSVSGRRWCTSPATSSSGRATKRIPSFFSATAVV